MRPYLIFLTLLLTTASADAWDSGGHMLVNTIAYNRLDPMARHHVDELIDKLPDTRTTKEDDKPRPYDFVSAGCWMDDIRDTPKYSEYAKWHFINMPCDGDPTSIDKPNGFSAIEDSVRILRSKDEEQANKVIALGILIHVVGDIHQPLHCTDRDRGGNTFAITGVPDLPVNMNDEDGTTPVFQRLHAYWDAAYRYGVITHLNEKRLVKLFYPGNSSKPDMGEISDTAGRIVKFYPAAKNDKTDAKQWISESNKFACEFAFNTPRKQQPSLKYFEKANDISCQRIALAGYRLARLLNSIYAKND